MVKKVFQFKNPFNERMKLNKLNKVQMVDAWTQTTPRNNDKEDKKEQKEQKEIALKKFDSPKINSKRKRPETKSNTPAPDPKV